MLLRSRTTITESGNTEDAGLIPTILICGPFADGLLLKQRVKDLNERLKVLEQRVKRGEEK